MSLFAAAVNILSAIAVTAHAVMGCCTHHEHWHYDADSHCPAATVHSRTVHDHHQHGRHSRHDPADRHDRTDHGTHQHQSPGDPDCSGPVCDWFAAQQVRLLIGSHQLDWDRHGVPDMQLSPALAVRPQPVFAGADVASDTSLGRCARLMRWRI